jgi:hypothetical protein
VSAPIVPFFLCALFTAKTKIHSNRAELQDALVEADGLRVAGELGCEQRSASTMPVARGHVASVAPQRCSFASSLCRSLNQKLVFAIVGKSSVDTNDLHRRVQVGSA